MNTMRGTSLRNKLFVIGAVAFYTLPIGAMDNGGSPAPLGTASANASVQVITQANPLVIQREKERCVCLKGCCSCCLCMCLSVCMAFYKKCCGCKGNADAYSTL